MTRLESYRPQIINRRSVSHGCSPRSCPYKEMLPAQPAHVTALPIYGKSWKKLEVTSPLLGHVTPIRV